MSLSLIFFNIISLLNAEVLPIVSHNPLTYSENVTEALKIFGRGMLAIFIVVAIIFIIIKLFNMADVKKTQKK